MAKIRIMLADDHTLFRQGIRTLISAEPDMEVVGEASNGGDAVAIHADFARGVWKERGCAPLVMSGPRIAQARRRLLERAALLGHASSDEVGLRVIVDGRGRKVPEYEDGYFVMPTVLDDVPPDSEAARTEIFGPVLSLIHAQTIEEAIALVNGRSYGNMACIFTTDGANARRFRYEVNAGNVGINVGVAAPMSTFPFSGWGESFFGDLHAQAHHAVEFFTQTKVVVERWPKEWSRKF